MAMFTSVHHSCLSGLSDGAGMLEHLFLLVNQEGLPLGGGGTSNPRVSDSIGRVSSCLLKASSRRIMQGCLLPLQEYVKGIEGRPPSPSQIKYAWFDPVEPIKRLRVGYMVFRE